MKHLYISKSWFLVCMLLLDGCGGTLGGNPEVDTNVVENPGTPAAPEGTGLSFALTDAPVADAKHVYVTIESVAVAKEDGSWIEVPLKNETEIDLLSLQGGLTTALAEITTIEPGTYTQTRLVLSETAPSRLIDLSGVEHTLKVPSGSESGLKINQSIVVEAGKTSHFTIDFDLRKSLKLAGSGNGNGNGNGNGPKYMLKPVLRLIEDAKSGSLAGTGVKDSVLCLYEQGASKDEVDTCETSVASVTIAKDSFKMKFIPNGTYELRVFRAGVLIEDRANIVVTEGEETKVEDLL